MNVGIFLSVRDKSTRFPGKVTKEIHGRSVTDHLIRRLKLVDNVDGVFLTTSPDTRDNILCEIAKRNQIPCYRGHPDDKIDRYLGACTEYRLDACVVVDGDDIFCFPEYLEETVIFLKSQVYDFVAYEGLPLGARGIGITKKALQRILKKKDIVDTEVWGHLFINDPEFICYLPDVTDPLMHHPEIRLTLDYPSDFEMYRAVYDELGEEFSSRELMTLLVFTKPELNNINKDAQQLYEDHINKALGE